MLVGQRRSLARIGVGSMTPIPSRAILQSFLTEFIDQHAGVRPGRMFGRPGAYAGRRLFAALVEDGIIVRLPEEVARREIAAGAAPFSRRGRVMGSWVKYRPHTLAEARRLAPILELSARHVAERQAYR